MCDILFTVTACEIMGTIKTLKTNGCSHDKPCRTIPSGVLNKEKPLRGLQYVISVAHKNDQIKSEDPRWLALHILELNLSPFVVLCIKYPCGVQILR